MATPELTPKVRTQVVDQRGRPTPLKTWIMSCGRNLQCGIKGSLRARWLVGGLNSPSNPRARGIARQVAGAGARRNKNEGTGSGSRSWA